MLEKTRGIVLKTFKYSETSVISKIYTEKFGQQSFLINGVRHSKAKISSGLLQPCSLLDMVIYFRESKSLQRVSEIKRSLIFKSIPFDITKSSATILIMEVLYKSIRETEANNELFNYIFNSVKYLDENEEMLFNFHLYFVLHLTKYIGCYPNGIYSEAAPVFDLKEGSFVANDPGHIYCITPPLSKFFSGLLQSSMQEMDQVVMNNKQKKELLDTLLTYYKIHVNNFTDIRSSQILEEVVWGRGTE